MSPREHEGDSVSGGLAEVLIVDGSYLAGFLVKDIEQYQ